MFTRKKAADMALATSNHHNEDDLLGESSDLDFDSVTESGRAIAHLVALMENTNDDMDFSISSGRSGDGNAPESSHSNYPSDPDHMKSRTTTTNTTAAAVRPTQVRSPAKAIPKQTNPVALPQSSGSSLQHPENSAGSTGSSFLSGIFNPVGSTVGGLQLSHTPPTLLSTSYESAHFGKRLRSGSISGRLRSASDLEERGLIDREQKGAIKDLIICGDEELQRALDRYEQGDPSSLEEMIRSGALTNRAGADIDLLGDLDLDFLTVSDADIGFFTSSNVEPLLDHDETEQQHQQHEHHPDQHTSAASASTASSRAIPIAMKAPPKFPTTEQVRQMTAGDAQLNTISPSYDGIGDLEFTGEFGENDEYPQSFASSKHNSIASSPANEHDHRIEHDHRLRSNSLFSALLQTAGDEFGGSHDAMYEHWMDPSEGAGGGGGGSSSNNNNHNTHPNVTMADAPPSSSVTSSSPTHGMLMPGSASSSASSPTPSAPTPKRGSGGGIGASLAEHQKALSEPRIMTKAELAEERRRERLERKEQKEKEKREKKERRELEKKEKQEKKKSKKDDDDVHEEHIPGSGRPRSMSDPNLHSSVDEHGLLQVERPDGWIGAYSPESRRVRIERFLKKRNVRVWTKTVKYDVRKNFADTRLRVKGRFVKKEDESLMRELMSLT